MTGRTKELPELVREAYDLSKQYLIQETVEPAKRLGRVAGFSFAAGVCFMFAAVFLGIAGMRLLLRVLPDGQGWTGLGYVLWAIALMAVGGGVIYAGRRPE